MNHTAWCPTCKRWRTWLNSQGEKRCRKCRNLCVNKLTGKTAQATGIRYPWQQIFDANGLLKWVRWFSPTERYDNA